MLFVTVSIMTTLPVSAITARSKVITKLAFVGTFVLSSAGERLVIKNSSVLKFHVSD